MSSIPEARAAERPTSLVWGDGPATPARPVRVPPPTRVERPWRRGHPHPRPRMGNERPGPVLRRATPSDGSRRGTEARTRPRTAPEQMAKAPGHRPVRVLVLDQFLTQRRVERVTEDRTAGRLVLKRRDHLLRGLRGLGGFPCWDVRGAGGRLPSVSDHTGSAQDRTNTMSPSGLGASGVSGSIARMVARPTAISSSVNCASSESAPR